MILSSLEMVADGYVKVHGELTFRTILPLLLQSKPLMDSCPQLSFDLGSVTRTDSAGLAILIEWLRLARQSDSHVQFVNLPDQLMNIARVCNLETVLITKSGKT